MIKSTSTGVPKEIDASKVTKTSTTTAMITPTLTPTNGGGGGLSKSNGFVIRDTSKTYYAPVLSPASCCAPCQTHSTPFCYTCTPYSQTKFPCPLCPSVYGRLSDLKSHFSLKHPQNYAEFPELKTEGKYACAYCPQKFTRAKTLETHKRLHLKQMKKTRSAINFGEISFKVMIYNKNNQNNNKRGNTNYNSGNANYNTTYNTNYAYNHGCPTNYCVNPNFNPNYPKYNTNRINNNNNHITIPDDTTTETTDTADTPDPDSPDMAETSDIETTMAATPSPQHTVEPDLQHVHVQTVLTPEPQKFLPIIVMDQQRGQTVLTSVPPKYTIGFITNLN